MKRRVAAVIVLGILIAAWAAPANAADPLPPGNVVVNGGFEQGFLGWTPRGQIDASTTSIVAHSGAMSYQVDTRTAYMGSLIWQAVPNDIGSFVLTAYVSREAGDTVVELVRDWQMITGHAQFISEVYFARPPKGTVRLRAWGTMLETDLLWPSNGWHELKVVADAHSARQQFFLDGQIIATVQAAGPVFSPEHLIIGDVPGIPTRALYHIDDIGLVPVLTAECGPGLSGLGGRVWLDENGDGSQDPLELGLEGVAVCAQPLGRLPTTCATTDVTGDYQMCVRPMTYLVAPQSLRAAPISGLAPTTRAFRLPVTVHADFPALDVSFGFKQTMVR